MVYIDTLTAPFVCLGEIGVAVIIKTSGTVKVHQVLVFVMKSLIKEVRAPKITIRDHLSSLMKISQTNCHTIIFGC